MSIRAIHRNFSTPEVQRSILRLLKENVLCSMSTVSPTGHAHINTGYFAYSKEVELFFYSYPSSQHTQNLRTNESMAVSIFNSNQVWGKPDRGMQLFGSCKEARGELAARAEQIYGSRFPGFKKWKAGLERKEGEFNLRAYRFAPDRAKILDEPRFGGGVFVEAKLRG